MPKLHKDLLEQAKHLAARERSRPKQASLRRAVSAAYYALFHAITSDFASHFKAGVRTSAGRVFDHGKMKTAAANIARTGTLLVMIGSPSCPAALKQVADDFVRLQQERHDADYNLGKVFLRGTVNSSINRADRSIASLEIARRTCPAELDAFVIELLNPRR